VQFAADTAPVERIEMSDDAHLSELMRQCSNHTPLKRLAAVEQREVFAWLIDGGHMTRTGKPLERPVQPPQPIRNKPDGSPVYAAGADFRATETVTMSDAKAERANG
jgi:hypothetical protein